MVETELHRATRAEGGGNCVIGVASESVRCRAAH